jgi:hypothetical protein
VDAWLTAALLQVASSLLLDLLLHGQPRGHKQHHWTSMPPVWGSIITTRTGQDENILS